MTDNNIPIHLGLILDGNRRWAKENGLPQLEGHRKGYENLKVIGKDAIKQGIKYVSAYIFSTENWNRSKEEVEYLMNLLYWVASHEVKELDKAGIRVRVAGSTKKLPPKVLKSIEKAEKRTANNTKGTLILCLNYGGQQEIVDAVKKIIEQKISSGAISKETIDEHLYLPDIPPIDLIIRTSGEQRLSNFMLWRSAYSELYFTKKHWPEFSTRDLRDALEDFKNRQRRFGS